MLTAIGPDLGDADGVAAVGEALDAPHIALHDPATLRELAAVLAHAELYVGHSMHGYVVSASYEVPGVIVSRSGFQKYKGFTRRIGREADVARDWERAFTRADTLLAAPQGVLVHDQARAAIDAHWTRLTAAINDPQAGRQRRADFLRWVMARSFGDDGSRWLMRPFTSGAETEEGPVGEAETVG